MSKIRPTLQHEGGAAKGFAIVHESESGLSGLVNFIGIETPGLTSTLAIARYDVDLLFKKFL
jgi:hypothetical protein